MPMTGVTIFSCALSFLFGIMVLYLLVRVNNMKGNLAYFDIDRFEIIYPFAGKFPSNQAIT
jgi:hypothetical protein